MNIKKYSVYINGGLYASDLNKVEAECLTELLYQYLCLEDVEKIKIKEEGETMPTILIKIFNKNINWDLIQGAEDEKKAGVYYKKGFWRDKKIYLDEKTTLKSYLEKRGNKEDFIIIH